ncbi:MAG: large subunit ribosomal protein L11 [Parcubacteria group bacterium Gr01-1014_17]|nr:MAG: large subunit ribosomal protein L11 [Parcubacteria group bacterium Gr01-1014_17]
MAKKLIRKLKVTVAGGAATPAPPLGPALGQAKVNIGEFVTRFNAATQKMKGETLPVEVYIFDDKSFDLKIKAPTVSSMLLKAIGKEKGAGKPPVEKAGAITKAKLREIAEKKMQDLNATTIEAAEKIIAGSARSMGIEVK